MGAEAPLVVNGVRLVNTDGITGADNGGKVLALVNLIGDDRQVRLTPIENIDNFLIAHGSHGAIIGQAAASLTPGR